MVSWGPGGSQELAGNETGRAGSMTGERGGSWASLRGAGRWLGHQWIDESLSLQFWNIPWASGLCSQVLRFGVCRDWLSYLCAPVTCASVCPPFFCEASRESSLSRLGGAGLPRTEMVNKIVPT